MKSIIFVIFLLMGQTIKASFIALVVTGIVGGLLKIAGAPLEVTKTIALIAGIITFTLIAIKYIAEDLNNLRWSIRNEARNRYRRY
ncbi:MAG: hypothetical protein F6K24_56755 [Okeania sp. SIO2D1]|nr:hypothetical protein [Okeania sp. SIO2D1]